MQSQDRDNVDNAARIDFLNELKFQYEKDLELKNTLDSKASNMSTISGSIVTISLLIATFLISKITSDLYVGISVGILAIGILFAALAIIDFLRSYSVRRYRYAMGHEAFFDEQGYKKEVAKRFITANKQTFAELLAREYLESIKHNMKANENKANIIKEAQKYLAIEIALISILVGVAIIFITILS
jgi:hypothetical protein